MPVTIKPITNTNIIEVHLTGKLAKEDYEYFVPLVEKKIEEIGKLRVLMVMRDFHGWAASALWEDIKFDVKHFKDIERLAMVGESTWEKGMAAFCKPFTSAKIKYYNLTEEEAARQWITDHLAAEEEELDPNEVVKIYTTHDAYHAEIIANSLRNEGIACRVGDVRQGGLTGVFEVDLYCREKDADQAGKFIEEHEKKHS
jgi:UPF0288 family protein (methanogenesis marker protein 3)